ncbi:HAD domain-containing protein [Arthrobacter sp. Z4-13]
MKPIILLDIDGVLNPKLRPGGGERPDLQLSDVKVALVRQLATKGRIAWVSTWPTDLVAGLEAQLELEVEPLRVTLMPRPGDSDESTPKLWSVARWLARMEFDGHADWDSVVWIDDVLGPDVREWAHHHNHPVLLEKPVPDEGLTEAHVIAVQVFIDGEEGRESRP